MTKNHEAVSLGGIIARLCWMMLGPLALVALAYGIVKSGEGWFTGADLAFLGVLAVTMLARWLEFRGGHAETADGEPATPAHLRRYLTGAALIGLGTWTIANLIANRLLGSW